jgi:predicted DNA-binding transcriptional regulator AlpA
MTVLQKTAARSKPKKASARSRPASAADQMRARVAQLAGGRAFVRLEEVWPLTGLPRATVYDAAKNGEIAGLTKIGRRYLLSIPALEKFLG